MPIGLQLFHRRFRKKKKKKKNEVETNIEQRSLSRWVNAHDQFHLPAHSVPSPEERCCLIDTSLLDSLTA